MAETANTIGIVKSHDTFTVSLRPHMYFYRLEFNEFAAGLFEVLF